MLVNVNTLLIFSGLNIPSSAHQTNATVTSGQHVEPSAGVDFLDRNCRYKSVAAKIPYRSHTLAENFSSSGNQTSAEAKVVRFTRKPRNHGALS